MSKKRSERLLFLLKEKGLPPVPGTPVEARWIAANGDWWVKTMENGWFWMRTDVATLRWLEAPNGPP